MYKTLLTLLFGFGFCLPVIAQKKNNNKTRPDTVAYYMQSETSMANDETDAKFLRLIIKADSGLYNIEDFYMDAKPKLITRSYIDSADFSAGTHGLRTDFYPNGNKKVKQDLLGEY